MDDLTGKIINALPVLAILLFSASVHELAHGWVARREGDYTAEAQGRLTMNPISHIDPFMTIILPLIFYFSAGFVFGGAKPVPVNIFNLRRGKKSMLLVSAAGPASNVLLAIIGAILYHLLHFVMNLTGIETPLFISVFMYIILQFVLINLVLCFFNLLPIPPLDGSHILEGLLPDRYGDMLVGWRQYGMFILLILLFTNFLDYTLFPLVKLIFNLLVYSF